MAINILLYMRVIFQNLTYFHGLFMRVLKVIFQMIKKLIILIIIKKIIVLKISQLLTHKENTRKSKCKKVKSLNIETREEKKFGSIKEASEEIDISPSSVCLNCKKRTKVVKSKRDGMIYLFNYIE